MIANKLKTSSENGSKQYAEIVNNTFIIPPMLPKTFRIFEEVLIFSNEFSFNLIIISK